LPGEFLSRAFSRVEKPASIPILIIKLAQWCAAKGYSGGMDMTVVARSPLREFEGLFNRYNRLGSSPARSAEAGRSVADWRPAADIAETEKAYLIKADLPAVKKEDVEVTVNDGILLIKGERKYEKSTDDEKQHRVESFYGSFSRSFSLPADVDESAIHAESKDGVLTVHLPKTEVQKPKSIDVKVH
jgi:HSP20 family protein